VFQKKNRGGVEFDGIPFSRPTLIQSSPFDKECSQKKSMTSETPKQRAKGDSGDAKVYFTVPQLLAIRDSESLDLAKLVIV
jgi:hypothetical protein